MFDEFAKSMEYCQACPKLCQSACPVAMADGNESHTPWGMMTTLNQVRKKELPFDKELAALAYQCTNCMACTQQCEHGIEIPPILHEVRKEAVRQSLAPDSIEGFLSKFHRQNNPFSKDLLQKLKKTIPKRYLDMTAGTVYFPGCTTIAKVPETIANTFELFSKLKIDFIKAYPEAIQCCGYPLIAGGMEEDFIDLAEINYHSMKPYKTIVSGSPACVYTLRETYKKYHLDLESRVVTISEFLEPYLQNINYRLKKGIRTKLMYHDPCYSARYLNDVDLPRELIGQVSGYQPIEFYKQGAKTQCSGQGGCFSITSKEVSDDIAKHRLEEVYANNVQLLVSQCPSCIHKFRKNSNRLIVKDLVSYLNDCVEGIKE